MILLGVLGVGFLLGLVLRWWALVPALAFGIWIAATTDVESVPEWFLGLGYAVCVSIGVALGVVGRGVLDSRSKPT